MFTIGVIIFTAASLLGGFATDQLWLIAARVAQGVGGAIASPTALALIQNTYPEGPKRSRAMGVYAAMSGAGGSLGLLLGGILTDVASWRWVLFVNVPIGLTVAIAAPRVLGTTPTRHGRLDLPGALSVTLGMASLVYGLSRAATAGWGDEYTMAALGAAVVLLVTFVAIESKSPHALMPLHIFSSRDRAGSYVIMLCLAAAMFATFFFITQFVQNVLGYSPLKAGIAFLPMTIGIGGTANIISRLVGKDRHPTAHDGRPAHGDLRPAVAVVRGCRRHLPVGHRPTAAPRHRHGLDLRAADPDRHVTGAPGRGGAGLGAAQHRTADRRLSGPGGARHRGHERDEKPRRRRRGPPSPTPSKHSPPPAATTRPSGSRRCIAFVAFILAVTVIRGGNRMPSAIPKVGAEAEPEAAVA